MTTRVLDPNKWEDMLLVARAIDPSLIELDVVARKPIQGEAMHKVIAYQLMTRLAEQGIYLVREELL